MQLRARIHTNRWRQNAVYLFRDEARHYWERVWQALRGKSATQDALVEAVKYAESVGKTNPAEWAAQLHRFLFYVYPGDSWLAGYKPGDELPAKSAQASKSFLDYLRDLADDHEMDPFPRRWYAQRGVTPEDFVRYLRLDGVSNDADEIRIVDELDAHMPWVGSHLREVYDLMRHPEMSGRVDEIRRDLERLASVSQVAFRNRYWGAA